MGKARAPRAKPAEPTEVVVRYDLTDLPTAFHKAGLAGLILLIDSLKTRKVVTDDEAKYDLSATAATVTFTELGVRKLMDDIYDARTIEVAVKSKWQGAKAAREPTAAEREAGTPFVYSVVQPRGQFLHDYYPEMPEEKSWLKLWRDMLWATIRPRDKNRLPYQERARGESCNEGEKAWEGLSQFVKKRLKNSLHTTGVSSALLPGAQDVNAEVVPFEGRADQNLLLHFWPFAVSIFVPRFIDADGKSHLGKRFLDDKQQHYAVAVPEVEDLPKFVRDYPRMLDRLSKQALLFRPAAAVIDLPSEGALAFMDRLAGLTGLSVEQTELRHSISAVEYLHWIKDGNNVKSAASGRVSLIPKLLVKYQAIVAPKEEKGQPRYRSPLFRRGLLAALLDEDDWYHTFTHTISTFKDKVFLRQHGKMDEKGTPPFANDAAKKFRHEAELFSAKLKRYQDMSESERPSAPLPVLVEQVIRTYLLGKAKAKCNLDTRVKLKALTEAQRADVYEKKRKVAAETFLAARSRRDADFVSYFSEVICSAGTYFDKRTGDFQEFATALNDPSKTDSIKALTLLALSANS